MLRMKLKCREQMQDINRYYLSCGAVIQGVEHPVWESPLHAAILQGNVQAVEILCAAGADKNKRIKSIIDDTERAEQQTGCIFIEHLNLDEQQAQDESDKWSRSNYVGLSAVELAQVLYENKHDHSTTNRWSIYDMLSGYGS
jgi:hypothetical protein